MNHGVHMSLIGFSIVLVWILLWEGVVEISNLYKYATNRQLLRQT